MKSELVPTDGGPSIPITKDLTVVGRREYCDIQLDNASLSKRHCVLVRTDGLLMVRDLVSTNGTKVNGQKIMWAALLPNDQLTLGRCKFRVYLGSDEAPSPSEKKPARQAAPVPVARPATPEARPGFAPLAPMPAVAAPGRLPGGSTDSDSQEIIENLDEFIIDDDEDEPFVIDLD